MLHTRAHTHVRACARTYARMHTCTHDGLYIFFPWFPSLHSVYNNYVPHFIPSFKPIVGSRYSASNVLLTNTTQLALNITLPPRLSRIHEEISLEFNESSIASEFTTHVPTAGELSSTVTIPHQARDHNDSSTVDLEVGVPRKGCGGCMYVGLLVHACM